MADKSAYVPVDAGGNAPGKDDLDIDFDADFFGISSKTSSKPPTLVVAPPPPPSINVQQSQCQSKPISTTSTSIDVVSSQVKSEYATSSPTKQASPKPKFEYKKPATYKKIVAYKRT